MSRSGRTGQALQRLERHRDTFPDYYAGMVRETLEDLASEQRHRIYKLLRLGFRFFQSGHRLAEEGARGWGVISRPAKVRHLAYKGSVNLNEPAGTRDRVR